MAATTVTIKESPAQLSLPGALVGRFIDDDVVVTPPPLSRRQRARARNASVLRRLLLA